MSVATDTYTFTRLSTERSSDGDNSILSDILKTRADVNDYRIVVFGAAGVGKSSLINQFVKGRYTETYTPTVEDTHRKVVTCDNTVCTLHITDTGGSHSFPAMQELAIRRAHAFILVFSLADSQSLTFLQIIQKEISSNQGDKSTPVMLIGNKSDLTLERQVSETTARKQANSWKYYYLETSAQSAKSTQELFEHLFILEKRRHITLAPPAKISRRHTLRRSLIKRPKINRIPRTGSAPSTPFKQSSSDIKANSHNKQCTIM